LCAAGLHELSAYGSPRACASCNQARALDRATGIVCALRLAVSPALAGAALERAAPSVRELGRVADHLAAHPTALIDGDSGAPLAVVRLIGELRAAGVGGLADRGAWTVVR
jgi:hypothetical protein